MCCIRRCGRRSHVHRARYVLIGHVPVVSRCPVLACAILILTVGTLPPGPFNAMTDAAGVKVGDDRLSSRTVRGSPPPASPPSAGAEDGTGNRRRLRGDDVPRHRDGEMTGLPWLRSRPPARRSGSRRPIRSASSATPSRPLRFATALPRPSVCGSSPRPMGWLSDIQGFRPRRSTHRGIRQRGRRPPDRRRQHRRRHRDDLS